MGLTYRSGGLLHPEAASGGPDDPQTSAESEVPRTLPELLRAKAERPGEASVIVYSRPGEPCSFSLKQLLEFATLLASSLLNAQVPDAKTAAVLITDDLPRSLQLIAFWGCILANIRPVLAPLRLAGDAEERGHAARTLAGLQRQATLIFVASRSSEKALTILSNFPSKDEDQQQQQQQQQKGEGPLHGATPSASSSTRAAGCTSSSTSVPGCRLLALDELLAAGSTAAAAAADVGGKEAPSALPKSGSMAFNILVYDDSSEKSLEYKYSHPAVLGHCRATAAILMKERPHREAGLDVRERLCETWLNWHSLTDPTGLLLHCSALFCGAAEVQADTIGDPRQTLRLASRHRITLLQAPPSFFRGATAELRRCREGLGGWQPDLSTVRVWAVQDTLLSPGEASEFFRLAETHPEARDDHRCLFASPWGTLVASCSGWGVAGAVGDERTDFVIDAMVPVPGVEVRLLPGSRTLQARGITMSPGASVLERAALEHSFGWINIAVPGQQDSNGGDEVMLLAGGLEYRSSEVEAAVEAAPGVLGGSTIATAASTPGTLAVTFVPEDPRAASAAAATTIVKNHLAVALGIRPKVLLPLAAADLPRDSSGRPSAPKLRRRWLRRRLLLAGEGGEEEASKEASNETLMLSQDATKLAEATHLQEEVLPSNWVFEEEFVPKALRSTGADMGEGENEGNGGEQDEEEGDVEDEVEERMEGVAAKWADDDEEAAPAPEATAAKTDPGQSGSPSILLITGILAEGGGGLPTLLQKELLTSRPGCLLTFASSAEAAASLSKEALASISTVLHLEQLETLPQGSLGSDVSAHFVQLLQAWASSVPPAPGNVPSQKLQVLSVSRGRHVRVAGDAGDARKSFLVGALLSAAEEWPHLSVVHLDLAPTLDQERSKELVIAEFEVALAHPSTSEVLIDAEGRRLERRLKQAPVEPGFQPDKAPPRSPLRAALLLGGTGGVGRLLARRLDASAVVLVGRSPATSSKVMQALRELEHSRCDVRYISASLSDEKSLCQALENCPFTSSLDFVASLVEDFQAPQPLLELAPRRAFDAPSRKLRGTAAVLSVLAAARGKAKHHALRGQLQPLPVLLASSAVGLLGASRLAPYAASARALEALAAQARHDNPDKHALLDVRCVALSAWASVGITTNYPVLAAAAPAAGLHVLSAHCGVLALEAAFQRFSPPRFGLLAVGVDASHPRFAAVIAQTAGASGATGAVVSTGTLPGCIDLVQRATKKVLGVDAKLGDSLVEAGLDSMSSLSMHASIVGMSGGLDLPSSMFYEHPTVLELATFIHRKAAGSEGAAAEGEASLDDALESMLEDEDARRSLHLAQAREYLKKGDYKEASERAARAAEGAEGNHLAAAMSVAGEALEMLGNWQEAGRALTEAVEARETALGPLHPDVSIAVATLLRWAQRKASRETAKAMVCQLAAQLECNRQEFLKGIAWKLSPWSMEEPEDADDGEGSDAPANIFLPSNKSLLPSGLQLRRLKLDDRNLQNLDLSMLGSLSLLETLHLRRTNISELPSALGGLRQLRELWLTGNFLSDLPDDFVSMTKLHVLSVERNRFARLPDVVHKLKRLIHLSLDEQRCDLEDMSAQVLYAGVLSVLRARGCRAGFPDLLPPASGPPNLNTVFWANNCLHQIPSVLGQFVVSLRLLDLAHNQIAHLGDELWSLRSLRDLSLAGNRLREVPAAIGNLKCLQQLWLHGNMLEELPEELGELESLAILELHHNQLRALPLMAMVRLRKLNWLFAHGNRLDDGPGLMRVLSRLPRLKIAGLGSNFLNLENVELKGFRASFGLGWNRGLKPKDGVLSEQLTTCDFFWDRMITSDADYPDGAHQHDVEVPDDKLQDTLVVTFSAQGGPVAQGQAEVRALRDANLKVDALYVCDPANAWYLQDPAFGWQGLRYFDDKIRKVTSRYKRVFMWGGSMGGSAALLFSCFADCVHAFSPQVDLAFTWPTFASAEVRETFRSRIEESVQKCRGDVTVHVGEENHNDNRHAGALHRKVKVHLHDTANHNTMKHVKQRGKLLPLLKFEVLNLMMS